MDCPHLLMVDPIQRVDELGPSLKPVPRLNKSLERGTTPIFIPDTNAVACQLQAP
jgi:hypothetical protein